MVILCCATGFAGHTDLSAQSSADIHVLTFSTADSNMIRWVPANAETWKAGIKSGYIIERFTIDQWFDLAGTDPQGKGTTLTTTPLLPLPSNDTAWNFLRKMDPLNAFVYDAIHGKSTPANTPAAKKEEQLRYGFALKACDYSTATARAHGLYFVDRSIISGQNYVYRIRLAIVPPGGKNNPGVGMTESASKKLTAPSALTAEFRNKRVMLTFDISKTRAQYAGYIIERSEDSIKFQRINPELLVFAASEFETNKTTLSYQDSFPQNNKLYWYRVRGYSFFGLNGPPSETVRGKGKDEWNVYPEIDTLYSPDNLRAEMQWHLPVDSLVQSLKGFLVLCAPSASGPYTSISGLIDKSIQKFTDMKPAFTSYYLVGAISAHDDTAFSYPHLLQLQDNEPPPVVTSVSGVIDSNGVVHLSWKAVEATDLKGYRIYRSNHLREEFYEVSDSVISMNNFTDTITLHTLTSQVYYGVKSVDHVYNNAAMSVPCRLKRPDKIPPVAAVVKFAMHNDSCISLRWINSTSDDVMCAELKCSDGRVVGNWNGHDTVTNFVDRVAVPGNTYSYQLTITDSSGNLTRTNFPAVIFQPRIYPALKNFAAVPDFEKRIITIGWSSPAQPVDRYIIYKSKKGEKLRSWKTVDGTEITFIDRELYPGNTYQYSIKAVLKNGAETKMMDVIEVNY
ncbi:MAG TPA: fibronectin type III domain-containing protein [Bacteroidia bacterium]|nr:fibronectin type III domain-containing protein [Bacteroidia bacterium]